MPLLIKMASGKRERARACGSCSSTLVDARFTWVRTRTLSRSLAELRAHVPVECPGAGAEEGVCEGPGGPRSFKYQ